MNWKTWAPLTVAVILGLVAALVAKNMLSKSHKAAESAPQSERMVVAKQDIAPGHALQAEDLAYGQVPAGTAATGTFRDMSELLGRVVTTQLNKDQAIVAPLLAPEGSVGGLQSLVPAGMRAITLEVNEFSGVAGLLAPGCRVDVITTLHKDGEQDSISRIVAQNLKVSAVGQRMGAVNHDAGPAGGANDTPMARSITLLTTPKQAETIQLACENGRPWLVLRGSQDNAPADTKGVTLGELRGVPPKSAVAAVTPPPAVDAHDPFAAPTTRPADLSAFKTTAQRTVQVIRGVTESSVTFEVPAPPTALSATDTGPAVGGH